MSSAKKHNVLSSSYSSNATNALCRYFGLGVTVVLSINDMMGFVKHQCHVPILTHGGWDHQIEVWSSMSTARIEG